MWAEFSSQYLLGGPPITILWFRVSFLSLFLLPNFSNLHTPPREHTNLLWLGLRRNHPQNVGYDPKIEQIERTKSQSKICQLKQTLEQGEPGETPWGF